MTRLTIERMQELLTIHGDFEFVNDIDGLMTTLVPHPIFEFHPHNLKVEGYAAVREMYRRLCPKILHQFDNNKKRASDSPDFGSEGSRMIVFAADRDANFLDAEESRLFLEFEDDFTYDDGSVRRFRMFQIVTYRGELIVGERTYMDDDAAAVFSQLFDEEFMRMPGVGSTTEPPRRR